MPSSGMLRRVAVVRTDVSDACVSTIMVTRIGLVGTMLTVTSNRSKLLARSIINYVVSITSQLAFVAI
jgi:hypothetical protein